MANPGNRITANSRFADNRYLYPTAGLGKVGQYQMSGVPFVQSNIEIPVFTADADIIEITFPAVTRWLTVVNTHTGSNSPMRVGFSVSGTKGEIEDVTANYFVLNNGESFTGEWRVARVYLAGYGDAAQGANSAGCTGSIMAGLTGINPSHLSGNWSGSSGVG